MELQLRITKIIHETSDTKTFFLHPVDKNISIHYKAGQFLTLLVQHAGREVRRSYSLGSTPGIDEQLFITVKRKVNGEISRHLLDHFKEGDVITSLLPSGRFIIDEPVTGTCFFIAGGSGITPVFALIKDLLYHHSSTSAILINQSRNEEHIIYKKQLYRLNREFTERFHWIQLFSQPLAQNAISQRLINTMLEALIHDIFNRQHLQMNIRFYLCGPQALMRMAEFTLRLIGFSDGQIKKEHFVIESPPPAPLLTDTASKKVTIHFHGKKHQVKVAYPQNILDAALQKGVRLPYSCKAGRCSTCAAYCLKGKVVMSRNEVLTERDLAKGLVLTCVGFAVTDTELAFDE